MVKALASVLARFRSPWFFELAGASAATYGLYVLVGTGAAFIGAGVALLAKSVELEARSQ